ncbi:SDR family NAD(P)-dependent oxidoreductase [Lachnoclostridium sp. Marseille-P6806]|uniref:SDR family NAD(P)-dependent oxidoreductase n=1 Tax=Lachnoclostridium sp. Marseille-P6806 TaxID=2364793 RepID=UPI001030BBD5|nr:SDR family oxidoreductase [Lachnoclostridium sp. Marseille-P6806]
MELHLRGKVAVITGGGTGIGRAAAVEFAKEGVLVAAVGRRPGPLQELAEEFRENDWPFYWEACDVADRRGMGAFAGHVFKQFGALDIWMNNAGIAIDKPLMQFTDEDWNRMMATNLQAVYDGIRLAASYMIEEGGGVILNASSFASRIPHANGVIYAATKAAVSNLTKSTAAALAPYGIRVVGYVPGMIMTPISEQSICNYREDFIRNISVGRLGRPEELAALLVFLSSDRAEYITGVDVEISGGKFAVQDCRMPWRFRNGEDK